MASCQKCDKPLKREKDSIICKGYCNGIFHLSCVNLSEYDCRIINEKEYVLFMCPNCQQMMKNIYENMKEIKSLVKKNNEEIQIVKNKCNETVNVHKQQQLQHRQKPTYAMAVRNEPPVIIMPKSTQNSNETRKAIRNCIDPLSLSLKVQSVSNRKDGAIAINCEDDESREKIENEVKNKLANDYVVKIPKIKDPCVIVCGISSEWEKDESSESN